MQPLTCGVGGGGGGGVLDRFDCDPGSPPDKGGKRSRARTGYAACNRGSKKYSGHAHHSNPLKPPPRTVSLHCRLLLALSNTTAHSTAMAQTHKKKMA